MLYTVFTPTYNGARTLHRVVDSLSRQTLADFEWIVIDDGSTDGTAAVVERAKSVLAQPVAYIRFEENRGKPTAINEAVRRANGRYFLIADADDAFVSYALERMHEAYIEFEGTTASTLRGVVCNCVDQFGTLVGSPVTGAPRISDLFQIRYREGVSGEKWGFTLTEIMREHPFNTEIDRFVPETSVWFPINAKYKSVYINDALRVYYRNESGAESLSSTRRVRYPAGRAYHDMQRINEFLHLMRPGPQGIVRLFRSYLSYSTYAGLSYSEAVGRLTPGWRRVLAWAFWPLVQAKIFRDWTRGRL